MPAPALTPSSNEVRDTLASASNCKRGVGVYDALRLNVCRLTSSVPSLWRVDVKRGVTAPPP